MEIFSFINDILYKKSGNVMEKKELETEFQPFMIQRWISFYSSSYAKLLNVSINKVYKGVKDKSQLYKLFLSVVPKAKFKKLQYIKKSSKTDKNLDSNLEQAIEMFANVNQISKREVKQYMEEYGLDLTELKKRIKICQ